MPVPYLTGNVSVLTTEQVTKLLEDASTTLAFPEEIAVAVIGTSAPDLGWDVDPEFDEPLVTFTVPDRPSVYSVNTSTGIVLTGIEGALAFAMTEALVVADLSCWPDPPANAREEARRRATEALYAVARPRSSQNPQ